MAKGLTDVELASRIGINFSTLRNRFIRGWSVERMLTLPVGKTFSVEEVEIN